MKRYEKMTKKEIIKFLTCDCGDCPLHNVKAKNLCSHSIGGMTCDELKRKWLEDEPKPKTKSRWELCETDEDFIEMIDDAEEFCRKNNCKTCRLKDSCGEDGLIEVKAYGTEKVEVEE